eukprot:gene8376-5864_t
MSPPRIRVLASLTQLTPLAFLLREQSANLATRQAVAHREPDGELQL